MKKIASVLSIVLAAVALTVLILSLASAQVEDGPGAIDKTVSNTAPAIGDVFTVAITFTSSYTDNFVGRMTDLNPAPPYLDIITNTVTGAVYSATLGGPGVDGVVWEGAVMTDSVETVTFQMQVTGIPTTALATGYVVTNTAQIIDIYSIPGTLPPTSTAKVAITIMPLRLFLPIVLKTYSYP